MSVEEPVTGFGLNEAAAPAGSPDALSETLPVKPPFGVTVTPYVVGLPGLTVWLEGDAATRMPASRIPRAGSCRCACAS